MNKNKNIKELEKIIILLMNKKKIKDDQKQYRENKTDEQKQKMKDYQKEYRKNMTDEQKQKYKVSNEQNQNIEKT